MVTTGIKPSSNISSALVSAIYGRSSELGDPCPLCRGTHWTVGVPRSLGESASLNATGGGPPTVRGHFILPLHGGESDCPIATEAVCPRTVGGPPPVAFRLADAPTVQGHTHCPWTVGAPAQWAVVNFPRVSNLNLRTSV